MEARGEAEVTTEDGTTFQLRMNSRVIATCEKAENTSIVKLIEQVFGDGLRLSTVATLFRLAVVRKGDPLKDDDVYALIDEHGLAAFSTGVQKAFLSALNLDGKKGSENPSPTGDSNSSTPPPAE